MNRNARGTEKMTDAELSRKLGQYQRLASRCLAVGLLGVIGGIVSFFAVRDTSVRVILVAVLFFGGLCCAIFLGGGARKKLKLLLQEQLGDFFQSELEQVFGPMLDDSELCIDKAFLQSLPLLEGRWEECFVEDNYTAVYRGLPFSAANVRLDHVYRRGAPREGYETCSDTVFLGLVLRCRTRIPAPSPIRGSARTDAEGSGVKTGNAAFDRRFCVTAEQEQDASCLLTPEFLQLIGTLERDAAGKLLGFLWDGEVFSLAMETNYAFASIASHVDLDAARRSYRNSLQAMAELLDLLLTDTVLFAAQDQ